ncbi:thiamine/molybdopterin biosynthesis MoeB-like protein [compost metagenome]
MPVRPRKLNLEELEHALRQSGTTERNAFLLKYKSDNGLTLVLFPDGRAMVQGTDDLTAAKSFYSRYVGM